MGERRGQRGDNILDWSIALALRKMQEYARQAEVYERRYNTTFEEFEQRVMTSDTEHLDEWDDYVVWRGLHLAAEKWRKRYEELRACIG
ncbi:MAG: hypothetical protein H5T62_17150 [Anaerolineae bacterium]|nr:hypothetical protein [Anaerolineae bacterium]